FIWTTQAEEALKLCRHDKEAMKRAQQQQNDVLTTLSNMTTENIARKMDRRNIETLVTIQVHQKDVLDYLVEKSKKIKLKYVFFFSPPLYLSPPPSKKNMHVCIIYDNTKDAEDFEWQKQLRCYWREEHGKYTCIVQIADVPFKYCWEYLGCKERLVVTPLTDRCYITLTQVNFACGMFFGGAPAGPAGTGKTETVKDLGRALGKYVVVFNCSDQMRYTDTAKIYKGLCQSGSWGCFDEFNRIDLEVLSVVAQQIMAILSAMRARSTHFYFPGDANNQIALDPRCAFFITMNPGYAGRQELPENLKALFRSVAMMVPDAGIIIKVKLASVGYLTFEVLANKFDRLYKLCMEQLSKQRHYDFGLRNILSVLRTAGANLRQELRNGATGSRQRLEEMLMMRTLRDMNLSKLVGDDVGLFHSLLHDLFPNQSDPPKAAYPEVENTLKEIIEKKGLMYHTGCTYFFFFFLEESTFSLKKKKKIYYFMAICCNAIFLKGVSKIIQLYETSLVRHGLMMIGPPGSGKSEAVWALLEALSSVKKKKFFHVFLFHVEVRMNPKAMRANEMFGENDTVSGEWTDGVFSSIWSKYNDSTKNQVTWITCDGPVDAIWIENLNTVLDDNKLLTLANGDRIPMVTSLLLTDNVKILFEAEDLRNASPATVSRAGIIFLDSGDLGYDYFCVCACVHANKLESDMFEWLKKNTRFVFQSPVNHLIVNLLGLLDSLLSYSVNEQRVYEAGALENIFIYSCLWSLGALFEREDQIKFSKKITEIAQRNNHQALMPAIDYDNNTVDETMYEYVVDIVGSLKGEVNGNGWKKWEAPEWKYPKVFKFSECLIPTRDSIRAEYLLKTMCGQRNKPCLVLGSSGTGKTSTIFQFFSNVDSAIVQKTINFSSATTCKMFQENIEADIEKRQGKTYAPPGGELNK
ncbi:hypothetical protein RFI_09812, partial [Reticulomyxa filosa]